MNLHSEQINEISSALSKAQGEFKAAPKDGANPHFKSKFSTLHSHWEACRAILAKNGLTVTQLTNVTEDGKNMLVTMLCHSSGQWFKSTMLLKPVKDDPQGMGSCLTYARRYMLSAIVGTTSDDEDDDAEFAQGRGKVAPPPIPAKKPMIRAIDGLQYHMLEKLKHKLPDADRIGLNGWVKSTFGADSLRDIPETAFEKVLDAITKKLEMLGVNIDETA